MNYRLREIERLHLWLLTGAVCTVWLTGGLDTLSVLIGGVVMGLNFWLMRHLGQRLLSPARAHQPGLVMFLMLAKFALLIGIIALLFWRVQLDLIGFAAGATVLLVACLIVTLRAPQPALS